MSKIAELFDYTSSFVTPEDVKEFAPSDPGYPSYVRVFTRILKTHTLPTAQDYEKDSFDLSETIGLTRWTDAEQCTKPVRFRRFRLFTNSVAVSMAENRFDGSMPLNYTVVSLLDDATTLRDKELYPKPRAAFLELHAVLPEYEYEERPFLTLSLIIIGRLRVSLAGNVPQLIEQLWREEAIACQRDQNTSGKAFLWDATYFNQLNGVWRRLIDTHLATAPEDSELHLIAKELLTNSRNG